MSRYFIKYLTSLVSVTVVPFFRLVYQCVASGTDKYFAKALDTLADVDDSALSMYLHCKATAWLFPPVHSPNSVDDNVTQAVLEKDHEGPTRAGTGNVEDVTASYPILSEAEDMSDDGV